MKYRIYIDEVGNPDLGSSDNINHRYLSLTGVILELGHVQSVVQPGMESLKQRHFHPHPDEPLVFHRKEMLNAAPPFEAMAEPAFRERFDNELLKFLQDCEFTAITVCLDKKKHRDTYSVWRYDPYHYGLAVILERYVFFLDQAGCQGDVMAESRGGKEDRRLKAAYERLWSQGTDFVGPERFQQAFTSRQLKVRPKVYNIAGLQIADLVAHASRNEILRDNGLLPGNLPPFAGRVVTLLQGKYYRQGGIVYGKKFI